MKKILFFLGGGEIQAFSAPSPPTFAGDNETSLKHPGGGVCGIEIIGHISSFYGGWTSLFFFFFELGNNSFNSVFLPHYRSEFYVCVTLAMYVYYIYTHILMFLCYDFFSSTTTVFSLHIQYMVIISLS